VFEQAHAALAKVAEKEPNWRADYNDGDTW
jgi:hypothetical protein